MIFEWLKSQYKQLFNNGSNIVCLSEIVINGDISKIHIAPNNILGIPSRNVQKLLVNAKNNTERKKIIKIRRPVTLCENTVIGPNCVIYDGVTLQKNVMLEQQSTIRNHSTIEAGTTICYGAYIGDNVKIGEYSKIGGFICNDTMIGRESAVMGDLIHEYKKACLQEVEPSPIIGDNVLIGMNAITIGPVKICNNARVAAGSIVLKDISTVDSLVKGIFK